MDGMVGSRVLGREGGDWGEGDGARDGYSSSTGLL